MLIRCAAAAILIMAGLCGLSSVDGQNLHGRVSDAATGEPIAGVSLQIRGTTIGTATGADGLFNISLSDVPAVLVVSHLCCNTLEIEIPAFTGEIIEIKLEKHAYPLDTLAITSNPIVEVMKDKPFEILDYEFMGDSLLLLANMNGNMFQQCLLLVNKFGDTLDTKRVVKAEGLYRDFEGEAYFISKQSSFLISCENGQLQIEYVMEKNDFFETYPKIVDVKKPLWIISNYSLLNQKLSYYRYDETRGTYDLLFSTANQQAIERARWGAYFDGTEADAHFARVIVNRPVQAPLFKKGDTLILFNFPEKRIEFHNDSGELLKKTDAPFMKIRGVKERILKDGKTGYFYVIIEKSGISTIHRIDIITGEVSVVAVIPGFVFVDKIMIHGSEAYFLYREKSHHEQKKLFRMKL